MHCKDSYQSLLHCYGTAPQVGVVRRITKGGLDKTSRDFEPEYHFVDSDATAMAPIKNDPTKGMLSLTKIMKTSLFGESSTSVVKALEQVSRTTAEITPYTLSQG